LDGLLFHVKQDWLMMKVDRQKREACHDRHCERSEVIQNVPLRQSGLRRRKGS